MKYIIAVTVGILFLSSATSPVFAQGAGAEWIRLNKEASKLYDAGKYNRGAFVAKKALELAEKNAGPNHPDTATSLNILADLHRKKANYAEAELLYKRALDIRKKKARE